LNVLKPTSLGEQFLVTFSQAATIGALHADETHARPMIPLEDICEAAKPAG
jgi:hypothetical protein